MATPTSPRKPKKTASPSETRPPPTFVTRAAMLGSTFEITLSAHSASTNTRTPKISAGMLGFNGRRFDYLEWLEAHTDFARVLLQYREISPIGPFRVFVRKQSPV